MSNKKTTWLNSKELYNEDILINLDDKFVEKFVSSNLAKTLKLPLFFYSESRGQHNALNTFNIVFSDNTTNEIKFQHGRELISSDYLVWIKSSNVQDEYLAKSRGIVLHFSSQIEYVIRMMTCIKLEGYKNIEVENLVSKVIKPGFGMYGSFERQLKFLQAEGNEYLPFSYVYLKQLQVIRNNLAHSFVVKYIVPDELLIKKSEDQIDALLRIFNNTWLNLMKDFAKVQPKLIEMIEQRIN